MSNETSSGASFVPPPEATEAAFGGLELDACSYQPLDRVTVRISSRTRGDTQCRIRVCDPDMQAYVEKEVTLEGGHAVFHFTAGGALGTQYVFLFWPGEERHSRFAAFLLDCDTEIASGDADVDEVYPLTRDALRCARRDYLLEGGKRIVGYMSADTWHFDGLWIRDWSYGLPAYRHWDLDIACGLDRFLERQGEDGMFPDGIGRDGETWRVGLESDVEYIVVRAVWQTWQATGDDAWLAAALPVLERALTMLREHPKHWDPEHELVKRQHSCDTWDFDIEGASDAGDQRHVIATCDQSGYCQAFDAMARMHAQLGHEDEAARWRAETDAYRRRANELLWDGTKYLHHVHLDEIDHADFDESEQLAMGNVWAMTRGLASPSQARSIIDEYRRRHEATGDAYPWWSLQPGYPDRLGYFPSRVHCRQGGYANGGLMPWVGGELCRAAFLFGRESYGVELLRAYMQLARRERGVHVWYWPNGEPGYRTTNETPYMPWGMAEWVNAVVEGLAGIRDEAGQLRTVTLSPRWSAAGLDDVRVRVRFAASKAYLAYRLQLDRDTRTVQLACTGSGNEVQVRMLLPGDWTPTEVSQDGTPLPHSVEQEDASRYVRFELANTQVTSVRIACR